ncbi:MAG: dephospho-CoA kinase [Anaerolineae bacterium]|nr:dephospho-CoA kinase [Caldilineales bacterium]MCX7853105.1 dephospho-CoA kinase [Caldilineales bacterium]MDW8267890.1 dephospho-CoA kinase [Anaerolineae bacterium]
MKPIIIGLTGNIGTGKTTVLRMLAERGAYTIDADAIAHQVMEPGGRAYEAVVAAFGPEILNPDGTINRQRLGQIVFADPDRLARLEQIVHPAVIAVINALVEQTTAPVVVIEAIKLLEAGMAVTLCDQVWVVTSPVEQQIERLMAERGMTREAAMARMASQSPQSFKISQADVVLDNSGTFADLERQVEAAWQRLGVAAPAR